MKIRVTTVWEIPPGNYGLWIEAAHKSGEAINGVELIRTGRTVVPDSQPGGPGETVYEIVEK